MIRNDSISQYFQKLSSNLPAPGAGCATAITAAQGASLLAMVCNLTLNKRNYSHVKKEIADLKVLFEQKRRTFLDLAEADMRSFESVIEAYKMRKQNEWDKVARLQEIEIGLKKSADVPFDVIKNCVELFCPASQVAAIGYKKVICDVHVGVALLNTAVECSRINLDYNMKQIKDKIYCKEKKEQLKKLFEENQKKAAIPDI